MRLIQIIVRRSEEISTALSAERLTSSTYLQYINKTAYSIRSDNIQMRLGWAVFLIMLLPVVEALIKFLEKSDKKRTRPGGLTSPRRASFFPIRLADTILGLCPVLACKNESRDKTCIAWVIRETFRTYLTKLTKTQARMISKSNYIINQT